MGESRLRIKEFKVEPGDDFQAKLDEAINEIARDLATGDHVVAERVVSVSLKDSYPAAGGLALFDADSALDHPKVFEWVIFYRPDRFKGL